VSYLSVSMLGGFHRYRYSSLYGLLLQWTPYIHKKLFVKAEKYIQSTGLFGGSRHHHLPMSPTVQVSVHMPCSDHTESADLLILTFCP
jgi:hypothetical protein